MQWMVLLSSLHPLARAYTPVVFVRERRQGKSKVTCVLDSSDDHLANFFAVLRKDCLVSKYLSDSLRAYIEGLYQPSVVGQERDTLFVVHRASVNCSQKGKHDTNENVFALEICSRLWHFVKRISERQPVSWFLRILTFALICILRFRLFALLCMLSF